MGKISTYKHIIWDWNGTLLDDVGIVVDVMNSLLKRRRLPMLDIETYRSRFTFPVINNYLKLGFDFCREPFEQVALEYIRELYSGRYAFRLHAGVGEILERISSEGISQSIVSASEESVLIDMVDQLGIRQYFTKIIGLDNHYANSKLEQARTHLGNLGLRPYEVLIIGDTIHDHEVAQETGCHCWLVSYGHQGRERLCGLDADIYDSIAEIYEAIVK